MDSVPYMFCLDVIGTLNAYAWNYKEMANFLTGRWKTAAQRYAENSHIIRVGFSCDDGQWSYSITGGPTVKGKSLDELLAIPAARRFIRHLTICVGIQVSDAPMKCSKEEIFTRLIPFALQNSHRFRGIRFNAELSDQDARMYFDLFRSYGSLADDLYLPYFGEESDYFISACSEHNVKSLELDMSWPQTEAVENLFLKYLSSTIGPRLSIEEDEEDYDSGESFNMSPNFVKAIVDIWHRADSSPPFEVSWPWYGDLEPVLSIPLAPNVTRAQPKVKDEDRIVVLWSKEDGSTLSLLLNLKLHYMRFNSPPNERIYGILDTNAVTPL